MGLKKKKLSWKRIKMRMNESIRLYRTCVSVYCDYINRLTFLFSDSIAIVTTNVAVNVLTTNKL